MTEKICRNCLCWDEDAGSEMGYCFRGGIAFDYTAADDSCQAMCINEHYVSVADIKRTLHDECGINIDGAASANE